MTDLPPLWDAPIGSPHPNHPDWRRLDAGPLALTFRHPDGTEVSVSVFGAFAAPWVGDLIDANAKRQLAQATRTLARLQALADEWERRLRETREQEPATPTVDPIGVPYAMGFEACASARLGELREILDDKGTP